MAKRVVAESYGEPDMLSLIDTEVPAPGPGEVSLRVKASGVNPIDYKLYSGSFGDDPSALPMPVGMEAAGVVTAVGDGAEGPGGPLSVGDEVIAYPLPGAYASELTVPASSSRAEAAGADLGRRSGLLLTGATAVHALTVPGSDRATRCWCTAHRAGSACWRYRSRSLRARQCSVRRASSTRGW